MSTTLSARNGNNLSSLKQGSTSKRIQSLIKSHETDSGYIDVRTIAADLGIEIHDQTPRDRTNVAELYLCEDKKTRRLDISPDFPAQKQNCAMAWVMAEYLTNKPVIKRRSLICSIFTLQEFRRHRYSRTMLLATRIVMTETAIIKMAELDNHKLQKELSHHITPEFANSSVKGHSVSFLLENEYI